MVERESKTKPVLLTAETGPQVDIIIPTWNNFGYLAHCLFSFLQGTREWEKGCIRIIVVNNGTPETVERGMQVTPWLTWAIKQHPSIVVEVGDTGENLGWEGGLVEGLKMSTAPVVVFMNDDVAVLPSNKDWLFRLYSTLIDHPEVGAITPCSNTVAGDANFFNQHLEEKVYEVGMLIGYCLMVRRDALDEAGGVPLGLPGGDDLDLSMRLVKHGWKLAVDRRTFLFHHGYKTGERVHGNDWNSLKMQDDTRMELIRRNGLKAWVNMMSVSPKELA